MAGLRIGAIAPRVGFVLVGVLLGLGLIVPIALFELFVQSTIQTTIAQRNTEDRIAIARTAGAIISQELTAQGSKLALIASEPSVATALRDRDDARLASRLAAVFDADTYAGIGLVDASAVLRAYTPSGEPPGPFVRRVAVDVPLTSEWVLQLDDPESSGSKGVVAVVVAPVRDGASRLGNLYAILRSNAFSRALASVASLEGRQLVVLSANGIVVAASGGGGGSTGGGALGLIAGRPLAVPELDRALRETGSLMAPLQNTEQLLAYAPVVPDQWAVYLLDSAQLRLASERLLAADLQTASTVAIIAAAALAIIIAILYGLARRQRGAVVRLNAELAAASEHKTRFLSNMSHEPARR